MECGLKLIEDIAGGIVGKEIEETLHENAHGFRTKRGTTTWLHNIMKTMDNMKNG